MHFCIVVQIRTITPAHQRKGAALRSGAKLFTDWPFLRHEIIFQRRGAMAASSSWPTLTSSSFLQDKSRVLPRRLRLRDGDPGRRRENFPSGAHQRHQRGAQRGHAERLMTIARNALTYVGLQSQAITPLITVRPAGIYRCCCCCCWQL